jgi:aspartate aminotransferase-like enzyme
VKIEKTKLKVLAHENYRAPHITTIVLPKSVSSSKLGKKMLNLGILVSYNSSYLLKNNWMQICFMGEIGMDLIANLADTLIKCYLKLRRWTINLVVN